MGIWNGGCGTGVLEQIRASATDGASRHEPSSRPLHSDSPHKGKRAIFSSCSTSVGNRGSRRAAPRRYTSRRRFGSVVPEQFTAVSRLSRIESSHIESSVNTSVRSKGKQKRLESWLACCIRYLLVLRVRLRIASPARSWAALLFSGKEPALTIAHQPWLGGNCPCGNLRGVIKA